MFAALFTTLLFAASTLCGHRTAKQIGGVEANFWRITLATILLAVWANTLGTGLAGAPAWFMLSGFFGIGIGDSAFFYALPRLGSRRTVLLTQCLIAPFAAVIEWLWLGTRLNLPEILCVAVILLGVAIVLAPGTHLKISPHDWKTGIAATVIAAIGGALGAVIIRKGYAALHTAGLQIDAGTTGYQRVLGGILLPALILLVERWRSARTQKTLCPAEKTQIARQKWRGVWPWVLANAITGQTLGVTCMQWALATTNAAVVTAIIATTPIVLMPMTRIVDGEKIGFRSLAGAVIAVGGVIGLIFAR